VPQLGCDRQADDAAADHGNCRPAHLAFAHLYMIRDNAGAAEAATMSIGGKIRTFEWRDQI